MPMYRRSMVVLLALVLLVAGGLDVPLYLGSRSAFFTRAEMPFFAAGGNRFQVFVGLNGQVF